MQCADTQHKGSRAGARFICQLRGRLCLQCRCKKCLDHLHCPRIPRQPPEATPPPARSGGHRPSPQPSPPFCCPRLTWTERRRRLLRTHAADPGRTERPEGSRLHWAPGPGTPPLLHTIVSFPTLLARRAGPPGRRALSPGAPPVLPALGSELMAGVARLRQSLRAEPRHRATGELGTARCSLLWPRRGGVGPVGAASW